MVQAKRVIERLAQSLDNGGLSLRIHCGAEDDLLEKVDGKMLRAGKCQEYSSGIEMLERMQVEKLIAARGRIHVGAFVRQ